MEFAVSQPKMVRLPRNKKQTYRLNSKSQMWPSDLILAMTLTLIFQGQFAITQPKMVRLPRNEKQTYRLNFRPWMCPLDLTLAMTLTLDLQGQMWNLLYLSQNGLIATKRKQTYCLYSRPQMWLWDMTLNLNFQGQIWNLPYLNQKWSDCHEMKANKSIEF